jgi:hypothetical protein
MITVSLKNIPGKTNQHKELCSSRVVIVYRGFPGMSTLLIQNASSNIAKPQKRKQTQRKEREA